MEKYEARILLTMLNKALYSGVEFSELEKGEYRHIRHIVTGKFTHSIPAVKKVA